MEITLNIDIFTFLGKIGESAIGPLRKDIRTCAFDESWAVGSKLAGEKVIHEEKL